MQGRCRTSRWSSRSGSEAVEADGCPDLGVAIFLFLLPAALLWDLSGGYGGDPSRSRTIWSILAVGIVSVDDGGLGSALTTHENTNFTRFHTASAMTGRMTTTLKIYQACLQTS